MTIIQTPIPVFVDVDGTSLESGYVYIGTANLNPETNPLAVYWDSAMLQPAAQPLRTSGGMIVRNGTPAVVHVTGNYSVTVRDRRGAIVYSLPDSADFDNDVALAAQIVAINAAIANISNSVDMSKGASLVGGAGRVVGTIAALKALPKTGAPSAFVLGYYAAGDGGGGSYYYDSADTTSLDNGGTIIVATDGGRWKLAYQAVISVKQFGAKGDGVAYDASAFNAAVAIGGEIFVPDGNYKVTTPIYFNVSAHLVGESKAAKIILPTASSINLFQIASSNVRIDTLYIQGDSTQTGAVFVVRTSTGSFENISISNIEAKNCHHFLLDENAAGVITLLDVDNCMHRQPTGRGVLLYDAYAFLSIRKLAIDYVGVSAATSNIPAIAISGNAGAVLEDCDVLGGTIAAMGNRSGFVFVNCTAVWLKRCMADTMGGYGFSLTGCVGMYLTNCTSSLCDQYGMLIHSSTDVIGSTIYIGGRNALAGTASQHGLYVASNSNVTFANIISKNNTGSGLYIDGSSVQNITNAKLSGNTGRGLLVDSTATASLVTGASFASNTAGNYSLAGGNHHLAASQLASGAYLASATGPATG